MPTHTWGTQDLVSTGPLIEVQVGVSSALEKVLRDKNQPVPAPFPIIAMLDTGATGTTIQQGLLARLGISPVGTVDVSTPTTTVPVRCATYAVRLTFPGTLGGIDVLVTEAPMQGQHIQGLIGRDILQFGVFVYIGVSNGFTLSF